MNQQEFIAQLERALRLLPATEVRDIVAEYQGYFAEALANGRSEAEFCAALGSPQQLAAEILTRSSVRISDESPAFETAEKSGYRWFRHAWHTFKQAPVIFSLLGIFTSILGLLVADSSLARLAPILSPLTESLMTSLLVGLAWRFEMKKPIDFGVDDVYFTRVCIRAIGLATIWVGLSLLSDSICDLIAGRPVGIYLGEATTGLEHAFDVAWSFVVGLGFIFAHGLIILQQQSLLTAIKLSWCAARRYWSQYLMLLMFMLIALLALVILLIVVNSLMKAMTGVEMSSEVLKAGYYAVSIFGPLISMVYLMSYSAWAAVFRDGSMRTEVHQS
jgi:uncharacterized membrane protein